MWHPAFSQIVQQPWSQDGREGIFDIDEQGSDYPAPPPCVFNVFCDRDNAILSGPAQS